MTNLPEPVREALERLRPEIQSVPEEDMGYRACEPNRAYSVRANMLCILDSIIVKAEERARDAARLEWLEKNGCDEFWLCHGNDPEKRWYDSSLRAPTGKDYFPTLRAAIDAAMQEPKP